MIFWLQKEKIKNKIALMGYFLNERKWWEREYSFRNLQFQYTFSFRLTLKNEKLFESHTQMKQFICSLPHKKKCPTKGQFFQYAEVVGFEPTMPFGILVFKTSALDQLCDTSVIYITSFSSFFQVFRYNQK